MNEVIIATDGSGKDDFDSASSGTQLRRGVSK
jgi:hypothetical protein